MTIMQSYFTVKSSAEISMFITWMLLQHIRDQLHSAHALSQKLQNFSSITSV